MPDLVLVMLYWAFIAFRNPRPREHGQPRQHGRFKIDYWPGMLGGVGSGVTRVDQAGCVVGCDMAKLR
jgi:hypothetical protein